MPNNAVQTCYTTPEKGYTADAAITHEDRSQQIFVCLGFNGTFSTIRLYRAIKVIISREAGDNTNT